VTPRPPPEFHGAAGLRQNTPYSFGKENRAGQNGPIPSHAGAAAKMSVLIIPGTLISDIDMTGVQS
jgi:hypothetical protein